MKAMVLHGLGIPLRLEEVPVPKPGPNEVLVRAHMCGVGLTVVILIGTPGRVTSKPRIPGHEIAGEAVAIGSEVRSVTYSCLA
jgi:propanol-preferring alcohol dehydrogenase